MHHFDSDLDRYTILDVLGRNALLKTDVMNCLYKPDGSLVAMKCTDIDLCPSNLLALLQREVQMSRVLVHPNVISYSSAFLHKSKLCVLMPLMEYGSCTDVINAHFKYGLPEQVIAVLIRDILKALSYIHSMHVVHRGVKGSHILISKIGDVKLTGHRNMIELIRDGIQVAKVHDFPKHDTSLLPWLSPEILQQDMQGYDTKSDIYSLGITVCELANGHAPFIDMPSTQMLLEKLNGTIPFLLDDTTVAPPPELNEEEKFTINLNHEVTRLSMIRAACTRKFSPAIHQFVKECMEREPGHRPTAKELLKHPFFKQIKNRTNAEIFQPVFEQLMPLGSDVRNTESCETSILAEEMEEMTVANDEWDFT